MTVRRVVVLLLAVVAIGVLLFQVRPDQPAAAPAASFTTEPARALATPATMSGQLPDGSAYTPRLYLDPGTSVGVAIGPAAATVRLVVRTATGYRELRRLTSAQQPQFVAFAVSGATLLWAETLTDATGIQTAVWRAAWSTPGSAPVRVTAQAGTFVGSGGQYDLVVHGGAVSWAARHSDSPPQTDIYSIGLDGRNLAVRTLPGSFVLSAWPFVVSPRAVGTPATMLDLSVAASRPTIVPVTAGQAALCSPVWCRVDTVGTDALDRIDLQHPDGSARIRLAGSAATPAIADATLLDRYVPLAVDGSDGTDLTLYDVVAGRDTLIATGVDDVQGSGSLLWWSTGVGDALRWCAVDVRTLP